MNDTDMEMLVVGTRILGEKSGVGSRPVLDGEPRLFVNATGFIRAIQGTIKQET
jgi:hypothetical protein